MERGAEFTVCITTPNNQSILRAFLSYERSNDIAKPLRLVITSEEDFLLYYSCEATESTLMAMCQKLLMDKISPTAVPTVLNALLRSPPETRSVKLVSADESTRFIFLISDRIDNQSFPRFSLPFERASSDVVAGHLDGLLRHERDLSSRLTTQVTELRRDLGERTESASLKLEELQRTATCLERRVEERDRRIADLTAQVSSTHNVYDQYKATTTSELEALRTELKTMHARLDKTATDLQASEKHMATDEIAISRLKSDIDHASQRLKDVTAELATTQADKQALASALSELDMKYRDASMRLELLTTKHTEQAKNASDTAQFLRASNEKLTADYAEIRALAENLAKEVDNKNREIAKISADNEFCRKELDAAVKSLDESVSKCQTYASDLDAVTREYKIYHDKFEKEAAKYEQAIAALKALNEKFDAITATNAQLKVRVKSMEKQMQITEATKSEELLQFLTGDQPRSGKRMPPTGSSGKKRNVDDLEEVNVSEFLRQNSKPSREAPPAKGFPGGERDSMKIHRTSLPGKKTPESTTGHLSATDLSVSTISSLNLSSANQPGLSSTSPSGSSALSPETRRLVGRYMRNKPAAAGQPCPISKAHNAWAADSNADALRAMTASGIESVRAEGTALAARNSQRLEESVKALAQTPLDKPLPDAFMQKYANLLADDLE